MAEIKKAIAIITARSGSKGLPDKNIKLLAGRPLIAHSISAALGSGVCDDVVVSTDSSVYAQIAEKYGAWVPFLRSSETSTDQASSWSAVKEVLAKLTERGYEYENIILLQPTSPLRTAQDIKEAFKLYIEKRAKAVVSVCEAEHSPLWCNMLDESMSLENFVTKDALHRRQQLGKYYRLNGAIYITSLGFINNQEVCDFYQKDCYAYLMPQKRSVDIDDADDFAYAEFLCSR